MLHWIGRRLADYLTQERPLQSTSRSTPVDLLRATLKPGDVILVEGATRVSTAIKFLTQSTWSHAALYVGYLGADRSSSPDHAFVEADLVEGVRSVGFEMFEPYHTRICRPVGFDDAARASLVDFVLARIGHRYDLKNVVDLARYLLPTPPVPVRWRRRMIALGSGDPTKAICSSLIAQAFQSIGYPILPIFELRPAATDTCPNCVEEWLFTRHHSLFVPRDFDVSPYFEIIKPTLQAGFELRALRWGEIRAASWQTSQALGPIE